MFLQTIKECVKLFVRRRRTISDGRLVATHADFLIARFLWLAQWQHQMKKIPTQALKLLDHIPDEASDAKSRRELATQTGCSTSTIRKYADLLEAAFLINSGKREGRGEWEYWKIKEDSVSLPVLQPKWRSLAKWIEENAGIGEVQNQEEYNQKNMDWEMYIKNRDDADTFYNVLSEQEKQLFSPMEVEDAVKQAITDKTLSKTCDHCHHRRTPCIELSREASISVCSQFKITLNDMFRLLGESWTTGYKKDFVNLVTDARVYGIQ